jgi:hypothetical protein
MKDNYFEKMTENLMNDQESKKDALGLDANVPQKKSHLHVTIPQSSLERLRDASKSKNLSLSVLVQMLIDEHC